MARKTYVLDTSVLVHDSKAITVFKDNDIIIPVTVLEEMDHLKEKNNSVGYNARVTIKQLDKYFESANPVDGVDIENGIHISIDIKNLKDSRFNIGDKDDNILACVASYEGAILVSKDVNMRLRAKAFNIKAQDYINDKLESAKDGLYSGCIDVDLDEMYNDLPADFWKRWSEDSGGLADVNGTIFETMYPNQFVKVTANGKETIYRRRANNSLRRLVIPAKIFDLISSRNKEQAMALELLLDQDVPLVSIVGKAGTGKTLISLAAGLEFVIAGREKDKKYKRLECYKSIASVGADIGLLPGNVFEKLMPQYGSITGAIETLFGGIPFEEVINTTKGKIKLEAISLLRGRSISNAFIYCDEIQNLTKSEIKTIVTRVGDNSKIVLVGDIEQIDNAYLSADNNALTHVIEAFKTSKLAGHVTLTKGERSNLATEAADLL